MSTIVAMKAAFDATTLNKNINFADTTKFMAQIGTTGDQTKTMSPDGTNPQGISRWVYRGGGISLGYPAFTMSMRGPTKASRVNRVSAKVVLPVLEQTSASTASGIQPAPTKAYDLTCTMDFIVPERASTIEKNAFLSFVLSTLLGEVRDSANANAVPTVTPLVQAVLTEEHPF